LRAWVGNRECGMSPGRWATLAKNKKLKKEMVSKRKQTRVRSLLLGPNDGLAKD
jgi:hypothetical protein